MTAVLAPVPRRRRWLRWALALALVLGALAWARGLVGLGLHALAMRGAGAEWQERGLWLPFYRAGIEARPIAGLDQNVSGLTFSADTGTLFTAINRPPELAEISADGRLIRRIALTGAADVEGITHVEGDRFIVVDEGRHRLSWVEIGPDTAEIDLDAQPFLTLDLGAFDNMGFEGVSWDQRAGRLMLAQEMWPVRVLSIGGLDAAVGGRGLGVTVREWRPASALGHAVADLSSLTVHDPTGNLLLLSHETSALAEYSPAGEAVSLMPLWRGWHGLDRAVPQAEGVAIGPDGAIYLVSEPNLFYRFDRSRPAPWAPRR